MKKFIFSYLLLFLFHFVQAQNGLIDSIKQLLFITKEDTTKVKLLNVLSNSFVWSSHPDTAVLYSQQALDLAEKIKYEPGIISAQFNMGLALTTLGNYPLALDFGFKALARAQKNNDNLLVFYIHSLMVICYRDQGDYNNALIYNREALRLGEQFHFKDIDIFLGGAATIFEKNNELDSAIIYAKKAYDIKKIWNGGLLFPLGSAYAKKGNYDSAMFYYKAGLIASVENYKEKDIIDIYNGIAFMQKTKGNVDSAIWYAKNVLSEKTGKLYPSGLLKAANLLTDIYESQNKADSTLKYLRMAFSLKDSLFGREKTMAIQNLEFKEKEKQTEAEAAKLNYQNRLRTYALLIGLLALLFIAVILLRSNRHKQQAKIKIEKAFTELKATQAQLVQSEKMASLGELTAGIAHEIQNPLNFVNNFSDVNSELLEELKKEAHGGKIEEIKAIVDEIISNEQKINHHGKRAENIVRSMLQHSRKSTGTKEPTDINALADEYMRLSYHGLRAKDKSFNAEFKMDLDLTMPLVNVIPQDIGRVLLNLFNNAFWAVNERSGEGVKRKSGDVYEPRVSVSTKKTGDKFSISVKDNGNGIADNIKDKIFQPFFTTKPTGQGTGLGLSLAYDIINAHGGSIAVNTYYHEPGSANAISNFREPGEISAGPHGKVDPSTMTGTTFIIHLPIN